MTLMSLEVYSAARPAISLRAWGMAVFLFLAASGLAGWLSRSRAGQVLSQTVSPPDWNISFRAPGRSEEWVSAGEAASPPLLYRATVGPGATAEIGVWRFEPGVGLQPGEVCDRITRPYASFMYTLLVPPPPKRKENLGPWAAIEAQHPSIPMVVRAAVLPGGEAYAVSLRVEGGTLDERLYRAFTAVCDSIILTRRPDL